MNINETDDVMRFAREQAAEAAELRLKVKHLSRRLRRAEHRLDNIYSSWTWRCGRVILFPVSLVRWIRVRASR
jgi:hypothetical protein